jgi:hypothetical protein
MPTRYHPGMKRIAVVLCLVVLAACSAPSTIPDTLGSHALDRLTTGDEACAAVQALHPNALAPLECIVATYADATLYVAAYPDADGARQDLLRMAMRLADGVAGFTPVTFDEGPAGSVFRTTGHGADHLFFRRGRAVVWLEQPTPDAGAERDLVDYGFPAFTGDSGA